MASSPESWDLLANLEKDLGHTREIGIEEFAETTGRTLYPNQLLLLKLIFLEKLSDEEEATLDHWIAGGRSGTEVIISPYIRERIQWCRDNDYPHFREIVLVGGRRSGKGHITATAFAYKMYSLIDTDVRAKYNIPEEKAIYFSCLAVSQDQAKSHQYADFSSAVASCPLMQDNIYKIRELEFSILTENDKRRLADLKRRDIKIGRDISQLRGVALAANAKTVRGSATLAASQPLDTRILTPTGWRMMGDLVVGDYVIAGDGQPSEVLKIHPQGLERVWNVEFDDGTRTRCSGDHFWTLYNERGKRLPKTRPLSMFAADMLGHLDKPKWAMPAMPIVEYAPSDNLLIHPYLLGALLGDGGITKGVDFYSSEDDLVNEVRAVIHPDYEFVHRGDIKYSLVKKTRKMGESNIYIDALRQLGLHGKRDYQKFIPEVYKRASVQDRYALLQGMMDTDGSVAGTALRFGGVVSPTLAADCAEVVRSLGGYATISVAHCKGKESEYNGKILHHNHDAHGVCISFLPFHPLFRLPRKMDRHSNQYIRWGQRHKHLMVAKKTDELLPMQCITIAHPSGLYVTENMIVTHNCFDEVAHMQQEGDSYMTASNVYDAIQPSLAQFGQNSLCMLNSSPYTKLGQFYEKYLEGMSATETGPAVPSMFSFLYPSWTLFEHPRLSKKPRRDVQMASPDWDPDEADDKGNYIWSPNDRGKIRTAKIDEQSDPEKFRVEFRSQWAEVVDAFLQPAMVERSFMGKPVERGGYIPFNVNWSNPLEGHQYYAHLDPSSTTAGFGFALAHMEQVEEKNQMTGEDEVHDHIFFDIIKRWRPQDFISASEGLNFDYEWVLEEIAYWFKVFRPKEISSDQFGFHAIQAWFSKWARQNHMEGMTVVEKTATSKLNWVTGSSFRDALYLDRVHFPSDTPDCNYLELELKNLQQVNTQGNYAKIEAPSVGPVQTKDLYSCVSTLTYTLIGNTAIKGMREAIGAAKPAFGAKGGYRIGQSIERRSLDSLMPNRGGSSREQGWNDNFQSVYFGNYSRSKRRYR